MKPFIAIPLSYTSSIPYELKWEEGEIENSINAILDLIIFSPKGSFSADPEFGFEYWNHEFSNLDVREFNNSYIGLMSDTKSMNDITRKQCELSLRQSILEYEPRLLSPDVKVELEINEKVRRSRSQSKYEMKITINGSIDDGLGVERPFEKKVSFMVEPTLKKGF